MLPLFGLVLLLVALVDLLIVAFGGSLTGELWSPLVFFALGLLFCVLPAPSNPH